MTICGKCGRGVAWHWITGRTTLRAWCYTGESWAGRRHDPWGDKAYGSKGGFPIEFRRHPRPWNEFYQQSRNVLGSVESRVFDQKELADMNAILTGSHDQ